MAIRMTIVFLIFVLLLYFPESVRSGSCSMIKYRQRCTTTRTCWTGWHWWCSRKRVYRRESYTACCPGYTNYPYCNIPICSKGCYNGGNCSSPEICSCSQGWRGSSCREAICKHGCYNGGRCVAPERCSCRRGWTGYRCTEAICRTGCYNWGRCVRPEVCSCASGWKGSNCRQAICPHNCYNGGKCIRPNTCRCASGWKGNSCSTAICSFTCFNGGRCVRPETCSCARGWKGKMCTQAICRQTCNNGAMCVKPNVCDCLQGWAGPTCSQINCGWKKDCYPGTCLKTVTCQCVPTFSGSNCEIMSKLPEFKTCEASLDDEQIGVCGTEVYTNKNEVSKIRINLEQSYNKPDNVKEYPEGGYLRTFRVGLINASYNIIIKDTGGSISINEERICTTNPGNLYPHDKIQCQITLPFTTGLKHKQQMEIVMVGKTGGYKEVLKEDTQDKQYINLTFTGQSKSQKVTFKFDLEPPIHCSEENTCCDGSGSCKENSTPLTTLKDITYIPIVNLFFRGWSDKDSDISEYRYKVYEVTSNGEGVLQENEKPIMTQSSISVELAQDNFNLPHPGMFSIIGEVVDTASNIRYCRAFVLYAERNTSIVFYKNVTAFGTTNTLDHALWRTDTTNNITINWEGVFGNPYLEQHNLLARIRKSSLPDLIDYINGNVSTAGTQNKRGIIKFQYVTKPFIQRASTRRRRSLDPPTDWKYVHNLGNRISVPPVKHGDGITFWMKAEDYLGNVLTDYVYILADNTIPFISDMVFRKNVTGPRMGYFSSVDLTVRDHESGIFRIEFAVYDTTGQPNRLIGNSTQQGQLEYDKENCIKNDTCVCTSLECFSKVQRAFINNCVFLEYLNVPARVDVTVYNKALLIASKSLNLGPVEALSGIDEYPPPYGFYADRTFGIGAILKWYLPNACYPIFSVNIEFVEGSGKDPIFNSNRSQAELSGLNPKKVYKVELYVVYENRVKSDKVRLTFESGEYVLGSGGLSAGVIVGIVIGVLVFLIIITVIILMVIRVKIKKQSAVPRQITQFGHAMRNRLSKHPSSDLVLNVAYKSGPKLKNFEDDIYAYGEMETDEGAYWKHSNDQVLIGKMIHIGRFAEIHKGTLKNHEGTRLVAIKMLKENTDDNILLMKAKMNFLATSVPHHNNIVNFVGAVTEGPLILLEYCDQSLKDWLKNIGTITDEIEDDMINFCTDISRGMKHLHDNEIVHRRLGARNVLLKNVQMMDRIVAKVTGFGPMKGEALGETKPELIPIKWMAPEQLGLGKKDKRPYNNQTDVWSFGITVWEIYSTGDSPFAKEKRSEVKRIMESGARPVQPDICSDELYKEVMMKCWEYKPSKRPSISEICSNLEVIFHGASGGDEYYDDQYGMGELYDDTI